MTDYTASGWYSIPRRDWDAAVSRFRRRLSFTVERAEFRPRYGKPRPEWFVVPMLDDAPLPGWKDDESFGYFLWEVGLSGRPGEGFRTRKSALAEADRLLDDAAARLIADTGSFIFEDEWTCTEVVSTVMAS